jgi:uncharacterized protein YndB with AHSA1/START domain
MQLIGCIMHHPLPHTKEFEMSQHAVARVERIIEAEPSAVWAAISNGSEISKWFITAEFEPTVGHQYTFTHDDTTISGEVLRCDPPAVLEYTWNVSGLEGETTVLWNLTAVEAGTHVEIVHSNIDTLGDMAETMNGKFANGWEQAFDGLAAHLTGAPA